MNTDALKLTTYFGERDRAGGVFLADALATLYAERRVPTSVLLRGVLGFGASHHLHSARLLTLSEDLPVVSVAIDTRDRIEAILDDVLAITSRGLITLERARLLTGNIDAEGAEALGGQAKLTVYVGRRRRIDGRPAHLALVGLLREAKVAGATVLMGVDGTVDGARQRARFFGNNDDVPLMVIAVGETDRLVRVAAELRDRLPSPLVTIERVQVLKRDGVVLAEPRPIPAATDSGLAVWRKLMVYAGEQARDGDRPLYTALVRELRGAGALGATALRGIWGYHGDHEPHGDRLLALRRRVPVLTLVVDTPERTLRWLEIIDALTSRTGLVTSELVPAVRARGPGVDHGGLALGPRVR